MCLVLQDLLKALKSMSVCHQLATMLILLFATKAVELIVNHSKTQKSQHDPWNDSKISLSLFLKIIDLIKALTQCTVLF